MHTVHAYCACSGHAALALHLNCLRPWCTLLRVDICMKLSLCLMHITTFGMPKDKLSSAQYVSNYLQLKYSLVCINSEG